MKNNSSLITIVVLSCFILPTCSCSVNSKRPYISPKYESVYIWKLDSCGCYQLRDENLLDRIDEDFSLNGKSKSYIIKLLGKPNYKQPKGSDKGSTIIYYFYSKCNYGKYAGEHWGEVIMAFDEEDKLIQRAAMYQ